MPLSLALDLGTTSTAAVAVDDEGRLRHVVRRDHGAEISGLPAGHSEQSPQRHWETALTVLKELGEKLCDRPLCLGLTGQMHSVLWLDASCRPLGNLVTWQDRRANEQMPGTNRSYLEEYLSRCDDDSLENTGCRLSPGYAAVTLFVLQQQQRLCDVERISLLADWVAARLVDGPHITDRSNAASTGVFDLRNDRWSAPLLEAGQLEACWFPDVAESGVEIGKLSRQIADLTGLPAGMPIMLPVGDNQASVVGSVPAGAPAIQITIGTGGQINWPITSFARLEGLDTRPLPQNRLLLVGAGLAGGDAFAWVARTLQSWRGGSELSQDRLYEELLSAASQVPAGAEGLHCEPFFRGTRREPARTGRFGGVTPWNFTPGHVARAVLEGIARAFYELWSGAGEGRPRVEKIIGCGNGLEQNPLLAQILSETFRLPLAIPQSAEAAACGAALLAGVKAGIWSDLEHAGQQIRLRMITESVL